MRQYQHGVYLSLSSAWFSRPTENDVMIHNFLNMVNSGFEFISVI
jgi:hypothetical protein